MPLYDYRCKACDNNFEARHGMNDAPPLCPQCQSEAVERYWQRAPAIARGMSANAGTSRGATKEELKDKWNAETPILRDKLERKLGKETVQRNAPHLYSGDT